MRERAERAARQEAEEAMRTREEDIRGEIKMQEAKRRASMSQLDTFLASDGDEGGGFPYSVFAPDEDELPPRLFG